MAQIHNSDLSKELTDGAKIQVSRDAVPNQLAEKVVPVMEVNPKLLKRCKPLVAVSSLSNATSATIFTCDSDRDTYLTSAQLSIIKDATSTSTDISIKVMSPELTTSQSILRIRCLTLTPQNDSISISFPFPMLLKRGSIIAITSDTAVANILASATIQGYIDDVSNA